jgi:hypothetical protein
MLPLWWFRPLVPWRPAAKDDELIWPAAAMHTKNGPSSRRAKAQLQLSHSYLWMTNGDQARRFQTASNCQER